MLKKIWSSSLKKLSVIILIAVFVLAPLRLDRVSVFSLKAYIDENGNETIDENTTWGKGDHVIDKSVYIDSGVTLTIEKGARILFDNSTNNWPEIYVGNGRIVAEGSQSEGIFCGPVPEQNYSCNIIFGADSDSNESSFFRYVEFVGGFSYDDGGGSAMRINSFSQKVIH